MNVEARVTPVKIEASPTLRALATITLSDNESEDKFVITGISVRERSSDKTMWVQMPTKKGKNEQGTEEWKDTTYPLSKSFRDKITECVLTEYSSQTKAK